MLSTIRANAARPNPATESAPKSLLVRFLEALIESRMRKAEQEIRRACRIWPIQ
jgi:hypothetical protein